MGCTIVQKGVLYFQCIQLRPYNKRSSTRVIGIKDRDFSSAIWGRSMSEWFDNDREEEAAAEGSNAGKILTSTRWNQSGTIYVSIGGEQTALTGYTYNKFCPNYAEGSRAITGCSNTADAQILYYWIEKGYDLQLSVTTNNYFKIKGDSNTYYVSDTAHAGEGTLGEINWILATKNRLENGDFIAALNFFCGVNNHSSYGSSTSTSWSYSVSATGKCAASFVSAGFDSYYFIARKASGSVPGLFFIGEDGLNEIGLSIMRENIDYGEPIRIGIPNHAVYMDGYRIDPDTGEYEYHLNYGWGTRSSSTKWYTVSELEKESITYVTIDLTPDLKVRVSNARADYYGGSFLRGMERINHIVNDKSTTFTFDSALAGETITLSSVARITSNVDVAFKNIGVSLTTTADELFRSARGMGFEVSGGSLIVNSAATPYAIRETGNSAVNVTITNGFIYTGNADGGVIAVQSMLAPDGDYSFGEFDADFRATVGGYAVKSGSAADTITLGHGAALFGGLDLGTGDNVLNIGAGSLFYGEFFGDADSLTVNMTIDSANCTGAAAAFVDTASGDAFHLATGGVINLDFRALTTEAHSYDLLCGVSTSLAKLFSVKLTVMGQTVTLNDKNREYTFFNLSIGGNKLVLNYSPVKPEVLSVTPDISDATNRDVTLTAVFSEDAVQTEYSTDGKKWKSYNASGVVLTKNGTVYFRARNVLGLNSDVRTFTVDWIDKTPPDAPTGSADITEKTKNKVTVTAKFSADSTVRQYSLDNVEWHDYTDPLVFSVNGAAYFRAFDAVGNVSKIASYTVANIVPSLNVESTLEGTLGYGSNYQDNYDVRVDTPGAYLIAGDFGKLNGSVSIMQGKTTVASGTIKNGVLTFNKGIGALLDSALEYTVAVKNSDKGKSASAYTLKLVTQKLYDRGDNSDDWTDVKTAGAAGAVGSVGVIDAAGVVLEDWVGFGDSVDYKAFTLTSAAKLSFTVTSTDEAKFTICRLESKTDKKGVTTHSVKDVQGTKLSKPKNATEYSAVTKDQLLEAGTYYLKVESTNAKKGGNADYGVTLNASSVFFTKGDNSDDWTDVKTAGAAGAVGSVGVIDAPGVVLEDWAGFGDAIDYKAFTLDSAAKLNFTVTSTDEAKFTICRLESKTDKKGVTTYSVKDVQGTKLSKPKNATEYSAVTKDQLLEAGTYYLKVESSNAKKGGNADYSVTLNASSVFFTKGDNSDDWTDVKTAGATGAVGSVGKITALGAVIASEWVGFGDAVDYKAFTLDSAAKLSFTVTSTDEAKFTICRLESKTDKKGVTTYSVKDVQGTKLSKPKNATEYSAVTKDQLLEAGTYYLKAESTNAKKGGNADYSVSLNTSSVFFTKGDNSDDDWQVAELSKLAAGDTLANWVGYGDKIDYRALTIDPNGGFYSFDLAGTENNVKLTVYALDAKTNKLKSVKSVTATAKKPDISTGDLCLNGATQYFLAVEAPNAAKAQNSSYTVAMTKKGTFKTWDTFTDPLPAEIDGLLTTAAGGDKFDCFDLANATVDSLKFDMGSGKAKVSFLDADNKAVKVAEMTMADGSIRKNVSSLTLVAENKTTDSFDIAALDDSIRYLKIEAATNGINTYHLSLIA